MKKNLLHHFINGTIFCARIVVLFSLMASQFFGAAPQPVFATGDVDVGIVLPGENGRWLQDKTRFEAALTTAGFSSEVLFSQDDSDIERTNVESLLVKNIKVLVICPNDGAAAAAAVEAARLSGVKVIAYDRLITNTDAVDFYVTFDGISVGQAQGQYLVDHATGSGNPLYLYAGSGTDNNAFSFFEGAWNVLQPKIADGTFIVENSSAAVALKDQATLTRTEQEGIFAQIAIADWNPDNARNLALDNLAAVGAEKGDVFILSPNDGAARAIADVFAADSGITSYKITGQDAERDSVQYIINGQQSMTVFKDIRTLADDTIAAAKTFLEGGTPTPTTTYNNGEIDVPTKSTEVVSVDQSNITAALIDSGYYSACDFTGIPGCPTFSARFPENQVHGYGWYPLGASIILTIDDPDNGVGVDHTDTQQIVVADWDPRQTFVQFTLGGFELQPGQIVSMTDGVTTRTHTVTNLAVTNVDPVADTVSGTAVAGSQVEVGPVCNESHCAFRRVTTNGSGNWLANFHVTGEDDDEQDLFDIVPGTGNEARQSDNDRNSTTVQWRVPNPNVQARANDNRVEGSEWPVGSTVTITVTRSGANITRTATVGVASWDPNQTYFEYSFTGEFDIQIGDLVSVTGGSITRTTTVTNLAFTDIDLDTDIVTGIASAGAKVDIWICKDSDCNYNRHVTADGTSGVWTADFGNVGTQSDEQTTVDISPGTWIDSGEYDANGNGTMYGMSIAKPLIEVSVKDNWIHARGWADGTEVTLEIDDPTAVGTINYTQTATMGRAPWNPEDPNDIVADFDMSGFTLKAQDEVKIYGDVDGVTKTKELTVAELQVTSFDIDADTVSGVATPNANVEVCVNIPGNCVSRTLTANSGDGIWSVDYTSDYDLQPGDNGWAAEYDADSDRTQYDWNIPNPRFTVQPDHGWVGGDDWTVGNTVTITVDNDANIGNGYLYQDGSQVVAGNTSFWFNIESESSFDLLPGQYITVSDTVSTKSTQIAEVHFDSVDEGADTAAGRGPTNAAASTYIRTDIDEKGLDITIDSAGNWSANFSPFDIQNIQDANVQAFDSDDDSTMAHLSTTIYLLTVSKAGAGSGTVTSNLAGVTCGADCSQSYNESTTVTLTAAPAAGSTFSGWSGACTGTGTCVVSMTTAKSVTVTFAKTYLLTVTKAGTGSGTVTSNPVGITCGADCTQSYNYNTTVTLTATPAVGSTFTGWSGACTGTGACVVSMTAAKSVTAAFALKTYALTVTKAGTGTGTVSSSPAGITCGADCSQIYNYNTTVTLTATPAAGSLFSGWSGACTGTGSCVVSMTAAKSVTATFVKAYLLTVTKAGNGTVTSSPVGINCGTDCSQYYSYNAKVTLTAKPATGSTFSGWSGACTGTGSCVVTMAAAKSVRATFTIKTYALTVTKAGTGSGTVTSSPAGINCGTDCSQTYNHNTKVTLTARPVAGSAFTGWSGACTGTGTCVVTMTAAKSVRATFTIKTYALTVTRAGTGSGTVTSSPAGITCGADCSQNYNYNTKVTLTARPTAGSRFTGWSGACTGTGTCVVTMTAAKSVKATFTSP
jgi:ABC-type xylose transport system substrate-binding protein